MTTELNRTSTKFLALWVFGLIIGSGGFGLAANSQPAVTPQHESYEPDEEFVTENEITVAPVTEPSFTIDYQSLQKDTAYGDGKLSPARFEMLNRPGPNSGPPTPSPDMWSAVSHHKAEKAWARGIRGEGVKVGIIGTGIDFGHPDLNGTQARVNDSSSPYNGWPIAFDAVSMANYLTGGDLNTTGTWYAYTAITEPVVDTPSGKKLYMYHTIIVDGTNDFWNAKYTPWRELLAEHTPVITEPNLALRNLYGTSDRENWYIGFEVGTANSYPGNWNILYGIYIDCRINFGGEHDPLGYYVSTDEFTRPEAVLYLRHNGVKNALEPGKLFLWDGSNWVEMSLASAHGQQAFDPTKRFVEVSIPKIYLNSSSGIATRIDIKVFTALCIQSHAMDSVPTDSNIAFIEPDINRTYTQFSSYASIIDPADPYSTKCFGVRGTESKSGLYHIGYLPDENLRTAKGQQDAEYPIIIVTDRVTAGKYDSVYIDLNMSKDFSDDGYACKGSEVVTYDYNSKMRKPDGIGDVSGGMVYFIADGETPLPYSSTFAERHKLLNRIPEKGSLVAFMFDSVHIGKEVYDQPVLTGGTATASAIVGQGNTVAHDIVNDRYTAVVRGIAPSATIIPVRVLPEGGYFMVPSTTYPEGRPGTVLYTDTFEDALRFVVEGYDGRIRTGDEANIVTVGESSSFGHESGSPVAGWDFKSRMIDYIANVYAEGSVAFTAATGELGPGYGTVTSASASPGVISSAIGLNFFYGYYTGTPGRGPHPSYGEIVPLSSRGPAIGGFTGVDVVSEGMFLYGAVPLYVYRSLEGWEGSTASTTWAGPELSSGITAGVLALIYEAYYKKYHNYPSMKTARDILKSAAYNLDHDPFVQGSGWTDADRATKLAAAIDGLLVSPSSWRPGSYRNNIYESFAKFMKPGERAIQQFVINNTGGHTITAHLSPMLHRKFGEKTYLNDTALTPKIWREIRSDIPEDTELLKITVHTPDYELFRSRDGLYFLGLYDCDDMFNPSTTKIGIGHENDERHANLLTRNTLTATALEARLHHPLQRTHGKLWLNIQDERSVSGLRWYITLEFYKKEVWDWVTLDKTDITLAPHSVMIVNATLSLPTDAPLGTYEAAIYVSDVRTVDREHVIDVPMHKAHNFSLRINNIPTERNYVQPTFHTETMEGVYLVPGTPNAQLVTSYNNGGYVYPGTLRLYNRTLQPQVRGEVVCAYTTAGTRSLNLSHGNIVVDENHRYTIRWNGYPMTNFSLNLTTGEIIFDPPLGAGLNITADYYWSTPYALFPDSKYMVDLNTSKITLVSGSFTGSDLLNASYTWSDLPYAWVQLAHGNVVPPLWLFKNGSRLAGGYSVNFTTGKIVFDWPHALLKDKDNITVSYFYYDLVRSARLAHGFEQDSSRILPTGVKLENGTMPVTQKYRLNTYNGILEFLSPPEGNSSLYLTYNYAFDTVVPIVVTLITENAVLNITGTARYNNNTLYSNYEFGTGFNTGGGGNINQGDWRVFYTDIPDALKPTLGQKFFVDLIWERTGTDLNVLIIGKSVGDYASQHEPGLFGEYVLNVKGGSDEAVLGFTTTNSSEEIVGVAISNGLTALCVRSARLNGTTPTEFMTSFQLGLMSVSPPELKIYTNEAKGKRPITVTFSTPVEGLGTQAAGPSAPIVWKNLHVVKGSPDWPACRAEAYSVYPSRTQPIPFRKVLSFYIWFMSPPNIDVDFCLHYDGNGNGEFDDPITDPHYDYSWPGHYGTGVGEKEEMKLIEPPDGDVFLLFNDFSGDAKGADIDAVYITMVAGEGFRTEEVPTGWIPANTHATFNISWDLSGLDPATKMPYVDATYGGLLYVGPKKAPKSLLIPIELVLYRDIGPETIVDVRAESKTNLLLRLCPTDVGTVEGKVLGVDGKPAKNVTVTAYKAITKERVDFATTDVEGHYQIIGLVAGDYVLKAGNATTKESNERTVTIERLKTVSKVNFFLHPLDAATGSISGQVTNAKTREPVWNAVVSAFYLTNGTFAANTTTDADGNYFLGSLPPANYRVNATKSGWITNREHIVTVTKAKDSFGTDFELTFAIPGPVSNSPLPFCVRTKYPAATRTISGWVIDQDNIPLKGVTVTATELTTGHVSTNLTASNGTFMFSVQPGIYKVKAQKAGYADRNLKPARPQITRISPVGAINIATPMIIGEYLPSTDTTLQPAAAIEKSKVELKLDGARVTARITDTAATYTPATPLSEGSHTVELVVVDRAGNMNTTSWTFTIDTTFPVLANITFTPELKNGIYTNADNITVSGRTDISGTSLTVNGQPQTLSNGAFSCALQITEGPNPVYIKAEDSAGNARYYNITIIQDKQKIVLSALVIIPYLSDVGYALPPPNSRMAGEYHTESDRITLYGQVNLGMEPDELWNPYSSVIVNNRPVSVQADGSFRTELTLQDGKNTITIQAIDEAGNEAEWVITVFKEKFAWAGTRISPMFIATIIALIVIAVIIVFVLRMRKRPKPAVPPPPPAKEVPPPPPPPPQPQPPQVQQPQPPPPPPPQVPSGKTPEEDEWK